MGSRKEGRGECQANNQSIRQWHSLQLHHEEASYQQHHLWCFFDYERWCLKMQQLRCIICKEYLPDRRQTWKYGICRAVLILCDSLDSRISIDYFLPCKMRWRNHNQNCLYDNIVWVIHIHKMTDQTPVPRYTTLDAIIRGRGYNVLLASMIRLASELGLRRASKWRSKVRTKV